MSGRGWFGGLKAHMRWWWRWWWRWWRRAACEWATWVLVETEGGAHPRAKCWGFGRFAPQLVVLSAKEMLRLCESADGGGGGDGGAVWVVGRAVRAAAFGWVRGWVGRGDAAGLLVGHFAGISEGYCIGFA